MIQPSFGEFKKMVQKGNLVAFRSDLPGDLETPISSFLKFEREEPYAFLLESAEQGERIGRYSFVGFDPELVLTSRGRDVFLTQRKKTVFLPSESDLLSVIRRKLAHYHLANPENLPNFAGGFVGFLGYENVRFFEKIQLREKNGLDLEEGVFFLVKDFLLFDHFQNTLSLITLCEVEGKNEKELRKNYETVVRKIQRRTTYLGKKGLPIKRRSEIKIPRFEANLRPLEFRNRVNRIKEYIRAGDCIQVVFSQRFALGRIRNDFEIYRALRSINPSPYMFYFRSGSLRLIGSSPELLVKKTGRTAELRPIAGTRPRGRTPLEDRRFEEGLKRSHKEMAEHVMLVDLGRNDLGRVCQFNSVQVSDFARVERYSHVMHLVSTVSGRLKPGKDAFDLLKATFPAGTVTGAPKVRAMQIIDELEPEKRGPYAGCLGYFSFTGDMDMCLTIRTVAVSRNEAYIQAGAGIVYDSQPWREYEETLNKVRALVQAVHGKERGHTIRVAGYR